jgi:CelD/BcsL family acetyltransferase involved in cellulose biosynthesis
MTSATRWRFLPLGNGLGEHAAAWDDLNARLNGDHPLLTSDFVGTVLRHFGDGRQTLCRLDGPEGARAMCLLQRRSAGFWASFLPSQMQLGPTMAVDAAALKSLVAQLPGLGVAADFLCVDPACRPVLGEDEATRSSPHALTMSVELVGGFEAYWAARPNKLRSNMRRYQKRAVEDGLPPRYAEHLQPAAMADAVRRYAELESAGWKGRAGTALAPGNAQERFYTELLETFAQRGRAQIQELWLGERLAGSRLIIEAGSQLIMLKTAYEESLDRYAPGRLLLQYVLERAFETHPGKLVEFYTDATQDQLAWATGQREISHWTLYRGAGAAHAVATARALLQVVRRTPTADAPSSTSVAVHASVDALPDDALRLFDAAESANLQLGVDWYRVLTQAVFSAAEVRFAVVREHDACVAVLPVVLRRTRTGTEISALSNYYTALYAPALRSGAKPQALAAAFEALSKEAGGASTVNLAPMDPGDESYRTLQAALEMGGWVPFRYFCFGNWYLRPAAGWPAYEAALPGRVRGTIERMQRRFVHDGGRLETVTDEEALQGALQSYLSVYARSWKATEPYPDFLPTLVRTFSRRGIVRMGLAWMGGQPVAAQLWFVAHGRADIYKLAHDEAYKQYSPGTLLTARMMREVLTNDGVTEVDYLIGDDPYKKDWMNQRRERWGLVAYNPRTLVGLGKLLRELLGRGVRGLGWRLRGRVDPRS